MDSVIVDLAILLWLRWHAVVRRSMAFGRHTSCFGARVFAPIHSLRKSSVFVSEWERRVSLGKGHKPTKIHYDKLTCSLATRFVHDYTTLHMVHPCVFSDHTVDFFLRLAYTHTSKSIHMLRQTISSSHFLSPG